jgi:hypothetical protein
MTKDVARLIVCEPTGRWAVAMRRELAETGVRVWETRSLPECWQDLKDSPDSFVVIELTTTVADDLLRRMAHLGKEFPRAMVAVVADRALADHQWLMREAGAVHFTCSPRQLSPLAAAALRHLARAPVPQQSLTERIWASLPWG